MHRIDGPFATIAGRFTLGDPVAGAPATVMTADWANAVQEELVAVITGAGLALNKPNNAQVREAIERMVAAVRLPAGVVFASAGSTVPIGWLRCDGALVSRTVYAALFAAIGTSYGVGDGVTTFKLPDLRGEFIRGVDSGRGVDAGRVLGSAQQDALQNLQGYLGMISGGHTETGVFASGGAAVPHVSAGASGTDPGVLFDASLVARTAAETRPRNVAMWWLIKT